MFLRRVTRLVQFAANESILHPKLRVIDSNGIDLGVLDRGVAINLARKQRHDLVLVRTQPEPTGLIGRKDVIESEADMGDEESRPTTSFSLDPCHKVKRIQFSPTVDVKDFERKVVTLRYFLIRRHRCELVFTSHAPSVLARILAEIRDVGAPAEEFDEAELSVKIWPVIPDVCESTVKMNLPLEDQSDSSMRPLTKERKRDLWLKSNQNDPRLRRERSKAPLDDD